MRQERISRVVLAAIVIGLQALAAVYFLVDAVRESRAETGSGLLSLSAFDLLVGFALLGGIAFGGLAIRKLLTEARRRDLALAAASGALEQLINDSFAEWGLTRAEAEVALFALKGCPIAEIATSRGAASGTVRSQLSQVYAKAGVTGQPMLMSLFLDELLNDVPLGR